MYVEDLKRGTNKDIGPKDIFEMVYNKIRSLSGSLIAMLFDECEWRSQTGFAVPIQVRVRTTSMSSVDFYTS